MINTYKIQTPFVILLLISFSLLAAGCSSTYYSAMEQVGKHKRDIMVDRVEGARDSQAAAQQQFKSALEQFGSVVALKNTDLKQAYDQLDDEYNDCTKAAQKVTKRIESVEDVAGALFDEWEDELDLYANDALRQSSKRQLRETKSRYQQMLSSMQTAELSMEPVLMTFRDHVLFLKHNLNAQAIGSLQSEFSSLERDIDELIRKMSTAIEQSDAFIVQIGN